LTSKFTNFNFILAYQLPAFKLQNNSASGVDVNSKANSFRILQTFKEFGYLTLA